MPIRTINRYTCPITGQIVYADDLPEGWFIIQGEVFSMEAQVPLAQYVVDHPGIGFRELLENLLKPPADPVDPPVEDPPPAEDPPPVEDPPA